jgi:hypothetical protein
MLDKIAFGYLLLQYFLKVHVYVLHVQHSVASPMYPNSMNNKFDMILIFFYGYIYVA